jgi:hypothetical protein
MVGAGGRATISLEARFGVAGCGRCWWFEGSERRGPLDSELAILIWQGWVVGFRVLLSRPTYLWAHMAPHRLPTDAPRSRVTLSLGVQRP